MGRRKDRARTPGLSIATKVLPATGGHPFYQRLHRVLDGHAFGDFVEDQCAPDAATAVPNRRPLGRQPTRLAMTRAASTTDAIIYQVRPAP
jgi:hypothetical protein